MADVEDRLWATPLDEQRRRDAEAERHAPPSPPDEPAPEPAGPAPDRAEVTERAPSTEPALRDAPAETAPRAELRPLIAIGCFALAIGIALGVGDRSNVGLMSPLESDWLGAPMECETARFEDDSRAIELFTCKATGDDALPPGLYSSPTRLWTSDVNRVDARESRIFISRDGTLTGWARY